MRYSIALIALALFVAPALVSAQSSGPIQPNTSVKRDKSVSQGTSQGTSNEGLIISSRPRRNSTAKVLTQKEAAVDIPTQNLASPDAYQTSRSKQAKSETVVAAPVALPAATTTQVGGN
jgi:hypothetical protein